MINESMETRNGILLNLRSRHHSVTSHDCNGDSNHLYLQWLSKFLFRLSNGRHQMYVWSALCDPWAVDYPLPSASSTENVSMWWRHQAFLLQSISIVWNSLDFSQNPCKVACNCHLGWVVIGWLLQNETNSCYFYSQWLAKRTLVLRYG